MNQPTLFDPPAPAARPPIGPTRVIEFTVPAVPKAQPRQRHRIAKSKTGKQFVQNFTPASAPVNDFKATVRMAAREVHVGPPIASPLRVSLVFVFPRHSNKFWAKKPMPRYPHVSTPDQDNLCKSFQDACNKLLWADDSQICQASIEKWHAAGNEQPHVEVKIEVIS